MSNEVDRKLTGYRWIETRHGDTLQRIALREFGDASRWAELAWLNDLIPPYITDSSAEAGPKVLFSGQLIMVPAATPSTTEQTDPEKVYGRDVMLRRGLLVAENGDFALVKGISNLSQAIRNRVDTTPGELMFHGDYGCRIRLLLGKASTSATTLLAAGYVQSAIEQDDRVSQVTSSEAVAVGDVIRVTATAQPVSGDPVAIEAEIS